MNGKSGWPRPQHQRKKGKYLVRFWGGVWALAQALLLCCKHRDVRDIFRKQARCWLPFEVCQVWKGLNVLSTNQKSLHIWKNQPDSLGCQVVESGRIPRWETGSSITVVDDDAAPPNRKVSLPKWMEKEEVSGLKKVTCHFWDFCDGDIFIRSIDAIEKEWLSLTFHAKKKKTPLSCQRCAIGTALRKATKEVQLKKDKKIGWRASIQSDFLFVPFSPSCLPHHFLWRAQN